MILPGRSSRARQHASHRLLQNHAHRLLQSREHVGLEPIARLAISWLATWRKPEQALLGFCCVRGEVEQ